MRIIIPGIGSRGDVQPYLNLAQGLLAAGHEVVLATNPTLVPLAESYGIPAAPVGKPVDMGQAGADLMARSFDNMWVGMIRVMQLGAKLVEEAYPDILQAARGADLLIATDTAAGIPEAETLGIPWISVTLQPGRIPTPNPNPGFFDRAVMPLLGRLFVLPTNRFRRRVGAPAVKDLAGLMSQRMVLLPVSPSVAPAHPSWPAHVRQTGYWYDRRAVSFTPPPDLLDFIAAGEPPIAVSLGVMSHSGQQAYEGARIVLEAVCQAGVRAVVQGWDAAFRQLSLPAQVYHAGSLPHGWLFPQMRAVVHHGGFGTTASVLGAGVPGVVVPHVIDQFYWGMRVNELGVGPKPISRGKLTVPALTAAIRQAVEDEAMRAKAAALGQQIRAEPDGVDEAVRLIEGLN
jgi:sterol 3beta-glucosyltransferase